ncbi:acetylornithine deacetylase/succinyl-diaminopimelate desuccinylase-like protein [Rhodobacter viridis]|uniref:Acetylornithine deacetylase/succinyl-diaminopimelate desuccinylase-like protein n=1 Tax=Rhodobacter viridis TaxID=1054202 RepID=A0A318U883_9RHOB|nr:dipeptidase [Rhodobacter viridis]PYF08189.1 acetylornithine deacetylase/succinyl-diaminopimelate desuccinylase-like protein [Rhodobacter viridis]
MTPNDYLDAHQPRFLQELLAFLAIPSVSANPAHRPDMARAADWVVARLTAAGAENARVVATEGHPVVMADWLHAGADRPTVLIYGHFDVQPPEPLDLWTTPPFAPDLRDGRVYARGASDDKGGMLIPILALEAHLATTGTLPVNVKFFFEGEEEIGSPSIPDCVRAHAEALAADMIFSADGLQWAPDQPQILEALKGILKLEIVLRGPRADQHSGLHGGGITNPAMALAQLLASMKAPDGRITIAGFYDAVIDLAPEDRAAIARIPYDETAYLAETGAPAAVGEPGYSTRERLWARPTLDVNGLTSGWQGDGSMTVLPAMARAKITCRLVAAQRPETVAQAIRDHVRAHTPAGVTAEVTISKGGSDPLLLPAGHAAAAEAAAVLTEVYGRAPYRTRVGGSIPILSTFRDVLGLQAVVLGFSHDDENLHAPNEFLRLDCFRRGQSVYARLFERLGGTVRR